jgi:phosphate/phosphite/phosphonate ABC transporter binding protein
VEPPAPSEGRIVFGLVPGEELGAVDAAITAIVRALGERSGLHVVRRKAESYDALERLVRDRAVHVAWLPPILFLRLEREGAVVPLVANERSDPGYVAALLVRADARYGSIEDLRGTRAAWVDPLSTTGYLIPRLELAARGIDPRTFFAGETFHRSHPATVRALSHRSADVAATYARLDATGAIVRGGWTDAALGAQEVRVLHASGPLPPDLIACRADLPVPTQAALAGAFVALGAEPGMRPILRRALGVDGFVSSVTASYDGLRETIARAASSGMIEAATMYLSTEPPPEE